MPATKDPVKDVSYSMGHDLTCWQFTFPLKMFSRGVVGGLHLEITRSVRQNFRRVVFPMGVGYAPNGHVSNSEPLATESLRVECHNDRGKIHRNCAHAHEEINPTSDKHPSCCRDSNHVIDRCSYQILQHLSVCGPRQCDGTNDVARITAYETIAADSLQLSDVGPVRAMVLK